MITTTTSCPPVLSSDDDGHAGGQTCSRAGSAKNLWVRTVRPWNFDLATYNVRTLVSEGNIVLLIVELEDVKWDIIDLNEVRRTGEELIGNFCSLSERVACLIIKLNNIHKIKVIQVCAPTSTYNDEDVDIFYEYVEAALELCKTQYFFIIGD